MQKIATSPMLSNMHAACLSREIKDAETEAEMREAAEKRIPYLLGKDKDRLCGEYANRLKTLRGGVS